MSTSSNQGKLPLTTMGYISLIALSTLFYELAAREAKVKVSILCPGTVDTPVAEAARKRLEEMKDVPGERKMTSKDEQLIERLRTLFKDGMDPYEVAEKVFDAIREEKFYILSHPQEKIRVKRRMEGILEERNPTLPA